MPTDDRCRADCGATHRARQPMQSKHGFSSRFPPSPSENGGPRVAPFARFPMDSLLRQGAASRSICAATRAGSVMGRAHCMSPPPSGGIESLRRLNLAGTNRFSPFEQRTGGCAKDSSRTSNPTNAAVCRKQGDASPMRCATGRSGQIREHGGRRRSARRRSLRIPGARPCCGGRTFGDAVVQTVYPATRPGNPPLRS